jgi:hypothetical protein
MQAPYPPNAEALAIAEGLQRLTTNSSKRSKAARLRDVLPDIEAAKAAGVKQSEIVKVLAASGLELSEKSLGVMLSRIKNKNNSIARSSIYSSSVRSSNLPNSDIIDMPIQESMDPRVDQLKDKSHDPAALKEVMRSKPSLDYYAKLHRDSKGKK